MLVLRVQQTISREGWFFEFSKQSVGRVGSSSSVQQTISRECWSLSSANNQSGVLVLRVQQTISRECWLFEFSKQSVGRVGSSSSANNQSGGLVL